MTSWPKSVPLLTAEQSRVREDFMKHWHEVLPQRYGAIELFNHKYPIQGWSPEPGANRVLEIGAGLGEHIRYEPLEGAEYHALELREDMASEIRHRFPAVHTVVGDIQQRLDFPDGYFDRVVAIHVLEHLPNLPAALREIRRVIKSQGRFDVAIPCEGGLAYTMARRVSAQRIFEKRYHMPYDWFVRSEHINLPGEIIAEMSQLFRQKEQRYFPFLLPSVNLNLVIGMRLYPN